MVTLRAFPVSWSIFWRYLIVFPFMVFGLLSLTMLALIVTFDIMVLFGGHAIAFYAIIALFTSLIAAIYSFPMMIGTRLGLTAFGHTPTGSYGRLIIPAIGYGLLVGLVTALTTVGATAIYLNHISMPMSDVATLLEHATPEYMFQNIAADIPLILQIATYSWMIVTAFYVALLVPLAAASLGRDPSGNPHTPFAGFGAGFIPLLALVLIVYVLTEVSVPALQFLVGLVGFGDRLAGLLLIIELMIAEEIPLQFTWEIGVILGLGLLFWLWTVSLLCAGATIVYQKRFEKHRDEAAAKLETQRMAPEEVRALWQSRKQPAGNSRLQNAV